MSTSTGEPPSFITTRMGKRGTLVIPAVLRQQIGLEEGTPVVAEARDGGVFIRPLVGRAISSGRRRTVLDAANRAYAALRADQSAWAAEQTERSVWDTFASETLPREAWSEDDFFPEK
jgi:AbrB family looped-hinge helix DNA binding protein